MILCTVTKLWPSNQPTNQKLSYGQRLMRSACQCPQCPLVCWAIPAYKTHWWAVTQSSYNYNRDCAHTKGFSILAKGLGHTRDLYYNMPFNASFKVIRPWPKHKSLSGIKEKVYNVGVILQESTVWLRRKFGRKATGQPLQIKLQVFYCFSGFLDDRGMVCTNVFNQGPFTCSNAMLYPTTLNSAVRPVHQAACTLHLIHHRKLDYKVCQNVEQLQPLTCWNYTLNADYKNVQTTTQLTLISFTKSAVQETVWKICNCSLIKKLPAFMKTKRINACVPLKPDLKYMPI